MRIGHQKSRLLPIFPRRSFMVPPGGAVCRRSEAGGAARAAQAIQHSGTGCHTGYMIDAGSVECGCRARCPVSCRTPSQSSHHGQVTQSPRSQTSHDVVEPEESHVLHAHPMTFASAAAGRSGSQETGQHAWGQTVRAILKAR
jgi:hypothetical protein